MLPAVFNLIEMKLNLITTKEILDFVHTESIFYKYYMERIREILGGKTPQDYSQMSKNRAAAAKAQQENKKQKAA